MNSIDLAKRVRLKILELCHSKNASHVGGALSVTDILAVLYSGAASFEPKMPSAETRDRIFYSKGHACTALYAVLQEVGFFSGLEEAFTTDGSHFTSHVSHKIPGIELSTGSLGHALPVAVGAALAAKRRKAEWHVFVIVSDGELDEGSNWESILFAPHHRLDNITLIVDYNKIQSFGSVSEVLNLEPLGAKFKAFGWRTVECDGHDHAALERLLTSARQPQNGKPTVIIANTIKGKGVSFMEGQLAWHYRSPNADEYRAACVEVAGT